MKVRMLVLALVAMVVVSVPGSARRQGDDVSMVRSDTADVMKGLTGVEVNP